MSVKALLHKYMGEAANSGYALFFEPGTSTPKTTYSSTTYATAATTNALGGVPISSDGWLKTYLLGDYDMTVYTRTGTQISSASATGINPQDAAAAEDETRTINLLSNGSFEVDSDADGTPDNWTLTPYSGSTNAVDTSDKGHGAQSMKFTSVGSGGGILVSDDFIPISPQKAVQVSFLLKSTADVRNLVEAIWYTAGGTEISDTDIYDNSTTNPTSWALRGSTVIPPSTAYYMKIRIYGCHSSDVTAGTARFDNVEVSLADTNFIVANSFSGPPLRGFISGFVPSLSTDTDHDLSFSTGFCRNSTNTAWCIPTWTTLIKRIDAAWAEGTNQGGMATGSVATSTAYYYNLIRKNSDETVFDIVIDVSPSQANTPSGWTFIREIHREFTDGSANLRQQTYRELTGGGIQCKLLTSVREFIDNNPGTDLVTKTIACPPGVEVISYWILTDGTPTGATIALITETGSAATEPAATGPANLVLDGTDLTESTTLRIFVDSSRNIEYELSQSTSDHFVTMHTYGWINHRRT